MMSKGFMWINGCELPGASVASGSMKPGLQIGDFLIFQMSDDPIRSGEIVVYTFEGLVAPIVHRVIQVHERQDTGEAYILTKGDNNPWDDSILFIFNKPGQPWLKKHHIMGRAVGRLPYVGWLIVPLGFWLVIILYMKPDLQCILMAAILLVAMIR